MGEGGRYKEWERGGRYNESERAECIMSGRGRKVKGVGEGREV